MLKIEVGLKVNDVSYTKLWCYEYLLVSISKYLNVGNITMGVEHFVHTLDLL